MCTKGSLRQFRWALSPPGLLFSQRPEVGRSCGVCACNTQSSKMPKFMKQAPGPGYIILTIIDDFRFHIICCRSQYVTSGINLQSVVMVVVHASRSLCANSVGAMENKGEFKLRNTATDTFLKPGPPFIKRWHHNFNLFISVSKSPCNYFSL